MAIRNIVQIGDPVLKQIARPVTEFDGRLHQLLDDMVETMFDAEGAGLAAPQVGISRQVFVVCIDFENVYEFVNPKIVKVGGTEIKEEGCLSVKGITGNVERPKKIVVQAFDRNGQSFEFKASGFLARAICHENDHLLGELFVDKIIKEPKSK